MAIALFVAGYLHRQELSGWILTAAALVAVGTSVGFFTPIVAVLGLLVHGLIWFSLGIGNASDALVISFDALALALLGPGAYSVDSYRFGRRVVVLPEP